MGLVYQINIKEYVKGECGLPKKEVPSALIGEFGVSGDTNNFRFKQKKEDPANRAVLLIPLETLDDLKKEGWPVNPGDLGENITTQGIPYDEFAPGERFTIGSAEIRIQSQAGPCGNLKKLPYITPENYSAFKETLKGRRGWYARVVKEGTVNKHDSIEATLPPMPHGDLGIGDRPITRDDAY